MARKTANSHSTLIVALMAGTVLGLGVPAHAQQSAPESGATNADPTNTDIVVTAERRSQSIQRVPLSVTALDTTELARVGINNAMDVTSRVPSLRFATLGGSFVAYNIRGVSQNDFTDHLEPPIALYVDDSYLSTPSQTSLPVFDMKRVEVLRGPQGTLFGRNATGGLIHFVSNQPTEDTEGFVDVSLTDEVGGKLEAAVGGSLGAGIQGRVAVAMLSREGYVDNSGPGGGKLGSEHYIAARTILAMQPSDRTDININARYYKNFDQTGSPLTFRPTVVDGQGLGRFVGADENPYGTCNGCAAPFYGNYLQKDIYSGGTTTRGKFEREAYGVTFKVDQELDFARLIAISDYQHLTKDWFEDTDGAPADIVQDEHDQKLDQFTQELRLAHETGAFRWTVGGFYYLQNSDSVNHYTLFGGVFNPIGTAKIRSRSIAAYAQADYDLTPTLTVTLGGRYTHDTRKIDFTLADSGVPLPPFVFDPSTYPGLARQSDNLYSFRGAVQWKPDSQTMLFASINRGTKGGNFALPFFLPAAPGIIPFKPEVLYSYEIGEKWTSVDGVLRINATAFYYDYKNYQAYIFAAEPGFNPVGTIRNLPAKAGGLELELTVKPVEGLTLGANLVGMDSKIKGVVLPNGDVVDRKLPQAPKFSGNGLIRYEMPVAGDKVAAIQANVVWQGKMSFTAISAPDEREGAWASGDLRISLGSQNGSWEAAVFARNLWNNHHRIWAYDLSTFGTAAQIYARPRTIGVSFRHNFN